MTFKNIVTSGAVAALLAASTTFAMAQATSKENNATSGAESGSMEKKDSSGSMSGEMKGGSSGSMEMKGDKPTSAGTSDNQAKDLRGHSEAPTTGSGK